MARYHYGVALYKGKGTEVDVDAAKMWLQNANAEGIKEAGDYLSLITAK